MNIDEIFKVIDAKTDNNCQTNRQSIFDDGEKLRTKLQNLQKSNPETKELDKDFLFILLRIIKQDEKFGKNESLIARKKTLHNFCATVSNLSHRKPREENVPLNFREKYYYENGRCIWRDLEFLNKTLLLSKQAGHFKRYEIEDEVVIKILEEDLPKLKNVIACEFNDSLSDDDRKKYRSFNFLPNIYAIANYHRERESLKKILDNLSPELFKGPLQIDISTLEGKLATIRILEIIGESLTRKNITDATRALIPFIDWDLLVRLRNQLAHHEWYLAHENAFEQLLKYDFEQILKIDLPFIKTCVQDLYDKNIKFSGDFEQLMEYYLTDKKSKYFFSQEDQNKLLQHFKWFKDNHLIEDDSVISDLIKQDQSKSNLLKELKETIGTENLKSSKTSESPQAKEMLSRLGQINQIIKSRSKRFSNDRKKIDKKNKSDRNSNLAHLRHLSSSLPKENEYKSKKWGFQPFWIINNTIPIIKMLEDILKKLNYEKFDNLSESFKDRREFAKFSGRQDFINLIKQNLSVVERSSLNSILNICMEHDSNRELALMPLEFLRPHVKNVPKISTDQMINRNEQKLFCLKEDIINAIKGNERAIFEKLEKYATFVSTANKLKNNPIIYLAAKYLSGVIFPYLCEINGILEPMKINEILEPMMFKELKCHRNHEKHGDIFMNILVQDYSEFVARYSSIFVKDLLPKISSMRSNIISEKSRKPLEQLQKMTCLSYKVKCSKHSINAAHGPLKLNEAQQKLTLLKEEFELPFQIMQNKNGDFFVQLNNINFRKIADKINSQFNLKFHWQAYLQSRNEQSFGLCK